MKKNNITIYLLWILLTICNGCSTSWTEVIKSGKIDQAEFYETINIEVQNGLIIVPILLNGKTFRFLLDSGAPFSISKELQNTNGFKIVGEGNIVDSDMNKTKVNYVRIDTIWVGSVPFVNQTAFVGDFRANPIIECLEIDGIVGSNLMRHCNWTINYQKKQLSLSDQTHTYSLSDASTLSFHTDKQYNILVNVGVNESTIQNLKIDYGSNGSISLPKKIFEVLKQKGAIENTFLEQGVRQTGIVGKAVDFSREIAYDDQVKFGNLSLDKVSLKSGGSGLIGEDVLSRFVITIDWSSKNLYLQKVDTISNTHQTFGHGLGYSPEKGVYVQSIVQHSSAFKNGVEPNMEVLKVDALDFTKTHSFCDYVNLLNDAPNKITLELLDSKGEKKQVHIKKTSLASKYEME